MLTVFRGETVHIFLLWLFGNSAVVLTVATLHCVRAPAWIPSWNLVPTHQLLCLLSCPLQPSWALWLLTSTRWHLLLLLLLLHVSKAVRHLSLSVWLVSLDTVSCGFFPVVMNVVISFPLGPFLWVCECFMKQCFVGHLLLFSYSHDSAALTSPVWQWYFHTAWWTDFSSFLYIPSTGIPGSHTTSLSSFWDNCPIIFFSSSRINL